MVIVRVANALLVACLDRSRLRRGIYYAFRLRFDVARFLRWKSSDDRYLGFYKAAGEANSSSLLRCITSVRFNNLVSAIREPANRFERISFY
jgi:hypothetical protein